MTNKHDHVTQTHHSTTQRYQEQRSRPLADAGMAKTTIRNKNEAEEAAQSENGEVTEGKPLVDKIINIAKDNVDSQNKRCQLTCRSRS